MKAGSAPRQHSLVWLQGLGCGAMATLAPGLALLIAALVGPGLLTLLLDREPGRPMARCVLLTGLAACVHPVEALWANGQSIAAALAVAGNIQTLGTAWSALAAGWLVAELAPLLARLVLDALARSRGARLRAQREALIAAWGSDPAGEDNGTTDEHR